MNYCFYNTVLNDTTFEISLFSLLFYNWDMLCVMCFEVLCKKSNSSTLWDFLVLKIQIIIIVAVWLLWEKSEICFKMVEIVSLFLVKRISNIPNMDLTQVFCRKHVCGSHWQPMYFVLFNWITCVHERLIQGLEFPTAGRAWH